MKTMTRQAHPIKLGLVFKQPHIGAFSKVSHWIIETSRYFIISYKAMNISKLLLFACCLITAQAQSAATPAEVYRKSVGAVVLIKATDYGGSGGSGTGSVIGTGYVLTNSHVVSSVDGRVHDQLEVFFTAANPIGEANPQIVNSSIARLIAKDDRLDLALLQVAGTEGVTPLPLARADETDIGEDVIAIGHPGGGGLWTLTSGRISARIVNFEGIAGKHMLQTETSLNPGNSGGPLLNYSGEIVGINTSVFRRGTGGMAITDINFAVRADVARNWLENLGIPIIITASIDEDFYSEPESSSPSSTAPAPPAPAPALESNGSIDGLSISDWLLVYADNPITVASLDKVIAYEQRHGSNAASRSYINKGLKIALAEVDSIDDLLEFQQKFGYFPNAPAQIEARLDELLEPGASSEELIRLRAHFPANETLRLQIADHYHYAQLFEAAVGEYQSWLGLTDSSHPERKQVLEALVAAREGRPIYKVGDIIQDCPECPQMVYIPTGSFYMGDIQGGGYPYEKPVHRVSVKAFLMSATEVTFNQWDACVTAGGCDDSGPRSARGNNGWGRGARPVIEVSWEDAQQYVKWISAKTGEQYRLPSEAEWEYAARAGSETKYSWGNSIGNNKANCGGCGSRWDDSKTAPVGSFAANAFGLYDMHGNVWEWTQDCWNGSYKGAPSDGTAWLSGECSRLVLRGGSWNFDPYNLRSAYRTGFTTGSRYNNVGFRLARTLD